MIQKRMTAEEFRDRFDHESGTLKKRAAKPKPGQATEDEMGVRLAAAGFIVVDFKAWLGLLETAAARGTRLPTDICVRQYPWGLQLDRKFRADFAFPLRMLLVEVIGGAHAAGHAKVKRDTERDGCAAVAGYRVCKVTTEQVKDGTAIGFIRRALVKVGPENGSSGTAPVE